MSFVACSPFVFSFFMRLVDIALVFGRKREPALGLVPRQTSRFDAQLAQRSGSTAFGAGRTKLVAHSLARLVNYKWFHIMMKGR